MNKDEVYVAPKNKYRMLKVKQILESETDTNGHTLTMERLIEILGDEKDRDRRSLYDDIRALEEIGTTVKIVKGKRPPVMYVEKRFFSLSELKLMIDAIASSKYMPLPDSQQLINKLKTFCSRYEANELNRQTLLANRAKHVDADFHNNVSLLSRAIESNKRVGFQYFRINTNNKKRFDKRTHFTSPWLTLYQEDNYYLLGYDRKRINYYRIDRISDLHILDEPRQGEEAYEKLKQELPFRTQSSFNLFGGEKVMVTLRCPAYYYNVIVDKFGSNLIPRIVNRERDICEVEVPVAVGDQFFGWIFSMKNKIEIARPRKVREKMWQMLKSVSRKYEYKYYHDI